MSVISIIKDFLDSVFRASNPEVRTRQALKKIESDLKQINPPVYKNGAYLPSVGEAFYHLYENTKQIEDILANTIFSEDLHRNAKYVDLLLSTGFQPAMREQMNGLSYEFRLEEAGKAKRNSFWIDEQHRRLTTVLKATQSNEFEQIEKVINNLEQIYDLCRFNYLSAIHQFDKTYVPNGLNKPSQMASIPISALDDMISDLYYTAENLEITASCSRAIILLAEQVKGRALEHSESESIVTSLKKIASVFKRVLSPSTMKKFLALSKKNPELMPATAIYNKKYISEYGHRLQQQFSADEQRIKTELKDVEITSEVNSLLGAAKLLELIGYNNELNNMLQRNDSQPLLWVTPMQVLKSFVTYYFTEDIKTFLNDLVVEGFFENTQYKTNFSETVFTCLDANDRIQEFENWFAKGGQFDLALLKSYIAEGHQNPDLLKKLENLIKLANVRAHDLIEHLANAFNALATDIEVLFVDAKKSKPDYISNIKVLFMSSRNKESADNLEKTFPQWQIFLEIMKNYVIIKNSEK